MNNLIRSYLHGWKYLSKTMVNKYESVMITVYYDQYFLTASVFNGWYELRVLGIVGGKIERSTATISSSPSRITVYDVQHAFDF